MKKSILSLVVFLAFSVTAFAQVVAQSEADICPAQLAAKIPPRPENASGGAAFIERLAAMNPGAREAAIVAEFLSGNVPAFLRKPVPVTLTGTPKGWQREVRATLCVLPDFLAIGSDEDFVRMPMDLPSSTEVARAFGFVLPTRKIVRAIHNQAVHKFKPEPMTPGPQMASPGYYKTHNSRIRAQREQDNVPLGALVAGHKKTIVLTNRLHDRKDRIAIFGWMRRNGDAIQPLSTVHGAAYADYSHGVRLVSETLTIDGQTRSIYDVLDDAVLGGLLSREGRIREPRILMGWPTALEST